MMHTNMAKGSTCPQCGKSFPSIKARAGHQGGAHGDLSFGQRGVIEHGTNAGYVAHLRLKEPFEGCDCRSAHAAYMRSHRALKKAWR